MEKPLWSLFFRLFDNVFLFKICASFALIKPLRFDTQVTCCTSANIESFRNIKVVVKFDVFES